MKIALFILAINFLIHNCSTFFFSNQPNSFLAFLGLGSNSPPYEKIQSSPEPEHDPLYILIVTYSRRTTMGTIGNPMLIGQYLQADEFTDLFIACPKKNEKETEKAKTDKNSILGTRTLVIENSYISLVNEYLEQEKQLLEERRQKDDNYAQNNKNGANEEGPKQDEVSNQEKIKNDGNVAKHATRFVEQAKQLPEKRSQNDENYANYAQNNKNGANEEGPKQDEVSNQEKIKDDGNVAEHAAMELDSNRVENSDLTSNVQDSESNIPKPNEEDPSKLVTISQQNIQDHGDTLENTAMELDSNQKKDTVKISDHHKDAEANSANSILESNEEINSSLRKRSEPESSSQHILKDDAVSKKNKVNASDEQKEKQDPSDQNKMEIDQASIQKTDEADNKKPETDGSVQKTNESDSNQTETLSAPESSNKISDRITPETSKFWLKAIDDANEFKCEKPVQVQLLEYPSLNNSMFKFYIAGFEVFIQNFSNLDLPEFRKSSDKNNKWFWSFIIVFNKSNRNFVCVYHEVQYNKDTYKPEINENFDNHDFGKEMMFPEIDMSQLYEIKTQEKIFQKLFKKGDDRKNYFNVNEEKHLVRVHLAPLHGFISPAVRQSAKTYGNVAPMWKSIRNGAWRKLEDYVNILSNVLKHLVVITGTYGTLALDGKEVYLSDDKKIPVPLAFWKMVIYQSDLHDFPGILIITSNNPYEDIGNVICEEDKCKEFGWGYVRENNLTRGRTICCDFTPDILKELPILSGAQPTKVLHLKKLSSLVDDIWEFDERGERTTEKQRIQILQKLKKSGNLEMEMIPVDKKTNDIAVKKEAKFKNAENIRDVKSEDAENRDPNKIEVADPLLKKEFGKVSFPNRYVEI